jgi:hypothetical protein
MKRSRRVVLTMMGTAAIGAVSMGFVRPGDCGPYGRPGPDDDGRTIAASDTAASAAADSACTAMATGMAATAVAASAVRPKPCSGSTVPSAMTGV